MITFISLQSFTGYAELSGAELDAFTKILMKLGGGDEHYVSGRYVQVRNDNKINAKIEVKPTAEFMSKAAYEAAVAEANAEAERIEAQAKAVRADWANRVYAYEPDAEANMIKALEAQRLLYWQERTDSGNPIEWATPFAIDAVSFMCGAEDKRKMITVNLDGTFIRNNM